MAFPILHHTDLNQDDQEPFWTKIAPYVSSNNMVLLFSSVQPTSYNVAIFDFVIVPNNSGGFPGGNGATAGNVMY